MVQWICFHLPTHSSIDVYLTYRKLYIFESAQFAKLWYVYPCEAITTSKMVTTSPPRKFPVSLCKSSFYPTPPSSPGTQWPAFCHCRLVCIFSRLLYKWKHTECSIFFFFLVWLFFAQQNYFEVCPHFWVLQKFIPFDCPAVFHGPVVPDFVDSIACWWTSGVPLLVAYGAALMAQLIRNPPAMWDTWVRSLGWEDPLEKGTANHSSILTWRIPFTV